MSTTPLAECVEFLREIGLSVSLSPGATGFFDRVEIHHGTLIVDPQCFLSDLLHEAGHLAVVPRRFRHLMHGDLEPGWMAMFESLNAQGFHPDSALFQAAMNCSDLEATAWSWAAGKAIGLPEREIIRDGDFQGGEAEVRYLLKCGKHEGISGLAAGGFCSTNRYGRGGVYPHLTFWTQEIDV